MPGAKLRAPGPFWEAPHREPKNSELQSVFPLNASEKGSENASRISELRLHVHEGGAMNIAGTYAFDQPCCGESLSAAERACFRRRMRDAQGARRYAACSCSLNPRTSCLPMPGLPPLT